jgi:hypothetical protein
VTGAEGPFGIYSYLDGFLGFFLLDLLLFIWFAFDYHKLGSLNKPIDFRSVY